MKTLNFIDYWAKAKSMKEEDREIFFLTFSKKERDEIKTSYQNGGWQDLFLKNQIDELCNLVKEVHNIDLYDLRIKIVLKNQIITIKKSVWYDIIDLFEEYKDCVDLSSIFGGIKIINSDQKMVLASYSF